VEMEKAAAVRSWSDEEKAHKEGEYEKERVLQCITPTK